MKKEPMKTKTKTKRSPQTSTRSGSKARQNVQQHTTARLKAIKRLCAAVTAYLKINGATAKAADIVGTHQSGQNTPDTFYICVKCQGTLPYYARSK